MDRRQPHAIEVLAGGPETHRLGDVGHAGLEPLRRRREGGVVHEDLLDHGTAGEHGRHLRQQVGATPQASHTGRAEHLVTAESDEVGTEVVHIHRHVRHGLTGIDHEQRTHGVRHLGDLRDRVDGAQDI